MSGGDFSLISDGIISLDARLKSGGNFSLRSVSGGLANFVSLYDPIISSNGDVDIAANYTGASLLVESKGNIRFQGDINVTRPDTSTLPAGQDTVTLNKSTALIMRSGQNTLAYGGVNSGSVPAFSNGTVPEGITLGGNLRLEQFNGAGGIVDLSAASGDVSTQNISTNGGAIAINSAGAIETNGQDLVTINGANNGGDISLKATNGSITTNSLFSYSRSDSGNTANGGNISLETTNGSITSAGFYSYSYSTSGSTGNGGSIQLTSNNGAINTTTGDLFTDSGSGNSGAIALTANGNITTGGMNSEAGGTGNGGDITLRSLAGVIDTSKGTVTSQIRDGSNGTGNAGAIAFTAQGDIHTATVNASSEKGDSGNIQFTSTNGAINTTAGDLATDSRSGNSGAIFLSASNNITTSRIISEAGGTGNGGDITLKSLAGAIDTTKGTLYTDSQNGNGGAIAFTANGNITTGGMNSEAGGTGNGGDITLRSLAGVIDTSKGTVTSQIRDGSNGTGNAGAIAFTAQGDIHTATVNASSEKGDSGNIQFTSTNGAINTTAGDLATDSRSGNSGAIFLSASNNITTSRIISQAGGIGNGGDITLISNGGAIDTTKGILYTDSPNGNSGAIAFTANGNITTGGMNSEAGGTGNGGDITLTSNAGAIDTTKGDITLISKNGEVRVNGYISTDTYGSSKGGDINITADSLFLTDNALLSTSTFGQGNGGTVNITASDTVSLNGGASARSDVESTATGEGGDINITTGSLSIKGNSLLTSSTLGKGNAGRINIFARNTVSLEDQDVDQYLTGLITVAGSGSVGKGGDIKIQAEHLFMKNNAAINADVESTGQGKGGDINLDIKGTILLTTEETYAQKAESARITLGVQPGGIGSGGTLKIKAGSLVLRNGGIIKDSTQGQGNAGNIEVNADVVDISGSVPSSGLPSGLFTSTNTTGKAGDIIIDTETFRIADGAALSARTKGDGQGGSIRVNATNTFEAINGGQLVSTTSGKGQAGDIFVNATDRLTISGTDINYKDRIAKFPNNNPFVANDIRETGAASGLIVNSTGSANAGNIEATAGFIYLNSQGRITAESASAGKGGNITLNVGKLLLLRRGNSSQISTTAGSASGGGDGGNITINAPNGFLVAILNENSDITANAFEGQGGKIKIRAQAVFGIQPQKQQTPQSDITASSKLGINGTVQINTPDVDPSRGLVELPTNLVDASREISNACTPGTRQFQNTFVATGRGGLPISPTEPLQDSSTVSAWVKLKSKPENSANTTIEPQVTAISTTPKIAATQIVEASGWVIDRNGNIQLVAQANQMNFHSPPVTCPVSQGGVKYGKTSDVKASN
ncbi:beta strand repeat-containing protein [Nostoc sp.]|uniref:beta strand repeat-containing protein n=1 Tax=Nostoc sp. TaxID=1180 RepID=UPI002FF58451